MSPLSLTSTFRVSVSALLLAAATHVGARKYPTSIVEWQQCPDDVNTVASLPVECATFAVPLDYSATNSTETLDLSLVKVPAMKQPAEHSILVNFGGPGLEVRHTLAELAAMIQVVTGGEYDLIGWDPRGVANTLTFSCFKNVTDRQAIVSQFGLANASDVESGVTWAAAKIFVDACAEYPEAQRRAALIGTASTARDAMQIVDAVEKDGLLRYWGFSYGTDLGAELAALFPGRIDKMVLDGVLNPTEYFYGKSDIEGYSSSDATLRRFFHDCISAPELCTLAQSHPNETVAQLESATYELLDTIKYRPIGYQGQVLGYTELLVAIRFALYAPATWLQLDPVLNAFFAEPRNDTLAGAILLAAIGSSLEAGATDDAPLGIECIDKGYRTNTYDDYEITLDQAESVSRLLGDALTVIPAVCGQWRLEPRERFTGRFEDVKPRNPVLIIGNTYDSATSIVSARNLSETIQGSGFLEHGGVGHTSIQQPSLCTARAIQNYFRRGTLPKPNTVCKPVEENAFRSGASGPTWPDLFPQLGFYPPGSNSTKTARVKRSSSPAEDPVVKLGRRQAAALR